MKKDFSLCGWRNIFLHSVNVPATDEEKKKD